MSGLEALWECVLDEAPGIQATYGRNRYVQLSAVPRWFWCDTANVFTCRECLPTLRGAKIGGLA